MRKKGKEMASMDPYRLSAVIEATQRGEPWSFFMEGAVGWAVNGVCAVRGTLAEREAAQVASRIAPQEGQWWGRERQHRPVPSRLRDGFRRLLAEWAAGEWAPVEDLGVDVREGAPGPWHHLYRRATGAVTAIDGRYARLLTGPLESLAGEESPVCVRDAAGVAVAVMPLRSLRPDPTWPVVAQWLGQREVPHAD